MKKITVFIIAGAFAFIQGCTATSQSVPVKSTVDIPSTDKNTLYVRANNWMVDAFKNAESVIQFSDKESGSISGRYFLATVYHGEQAYATIKVRVKDEAAKITVTPESFTYVKGTVYTEEDAQHDIRRLINSFETSMKRAKDSDW